MDARVTIWGFGSIAKTLTPILQALGAHVEGIATYGGTRAGVPVSAGDAAASLLERTDLLLMILPNTPHNYRLVGARQLACLPKHAWLVNVGRGSTLDGDALVSALGDGDLAGAALDVFEEEPLPPTSPLWQLENVIITPHASGGRPLGAQDLVLYNLARLQAGEPLENVIERDRGY
ncbi:MAG: NAD(P)-dependent oxidoreductase [Trueperaceae bacterium]|nr:NAD(P)-dependent oxidoreductase [Trueperaceae bacterium]